MGKPLNVGKWICMKCEKVFIHKQSLNNHKQTRGIDKLGCGKCSKTFKRQAYLTKHKKTCKGDGKVKDCKTCTKTFPSNMAAKKAHDTSTFRKEEEC